MIDFNHIQESLRRAQENLAHYKAQVDHDPTNRHFLLQVDNYEAEVSSLSAELEQAQNMRGKEIVELHLEGAIARKGSLPLDVLGQLSSNFYCGLTEIVRQIQFGEKRQGRQLDEIKQLLDLRLAKIGVGSTRLFITGQTQPDLFGRSLLQEGLYSTFDLLEAEDSEVLLEKAAVCGQHGVTKLNSFLQKTAVYDLSCDIIWDTPSTTKKEWRGDKNRIQRLAQTLSQIRPGITENISLMGEIITISLKGKGFLELVDQNENLVRVIVNEKMHNIIKHMYVGARYNFNLEKRETINHATKQKKLTYTLLEIIK